MLKQSVSDVRNASSKVYAPDGNFSEDAGYWEYGTTYHIIVAELLKTSLKDDFGLVEKPCFEAGDDYMLHVTGPSLMTFTRDFERQSQGLIWYAINFGTPLLPVWSNEARFIRGEELEQWTSYRNPFAL